MKIIKTKVIGDTITPIEQGYVIENQVNQYAIEFDFDETWNFEEKYCIFQDEFEEQTFKRAIINNQVIVPSELLNGRITIQVYGQNIEDNVITNRQPSLKYVFSILNSLPTNASEEQNVPTPTQWELYIEQIETLVDDMCDQFQEVKAQVELNTEDIGKAQQDIEDLQDRATTDEELIQTNATEISNIKRDYSLITETGNKLSVSIDSNYLMTITLKDKNNNILSTTSVDFPIESAIVNATYNNTTKEITFTLQNGNTLVVPIGDIISGLASQSDLESLANRVQTIENDYLTSADKTELQESITGLENEIELEQQAQDNNILALQNENEKLSRIVEGLPTKQANGTSFLLNDVIKANIKDYELRGNTTQKTTTGKNLFKPYSYSRTASSVTFTTENGYIQANGTASADTYSILSSDAQNVLIELQPGTYCISGATSSLRLEVVRSNGQMIVSTTGNDSYVIFTLQETTNVFVRAKVLNGTSVNNVKIYPQLEVGSTPTSYEEYTGGVPSPNPSYPQTINVATGNQEINVFGKNLYEAIIGQYSLNGLVPKLENDGSISVSGISTNTWSNLCTNSDICLQPGTYTFSVSKTYNLILGIRCFTNEEGTTYEDMNITSGNTKITKTFTSKIYSWRFYIAGYTVGTEINDNFKVQVELGNTATSYEKFTKQTKTISLGNIELNKIGDYQDRIYKSNGKWYLKKNIGKYVYNNDLQTNGITATRVDFLTPVLNIEANTNTLNRAFSNLLTNSLNNNTGLNNVTGTQKIRVCISTDIASTYEQALTYLQGLIIYYIYETPTITEITDTSLISQLEDILNIILNENNTIIINGNLPSDTLVIGYADIAKLIASLSSQDNRSVEENTRKGGNTEEPKEETEPIEEPIETKEEER